ncbi:hypothetical protein OH76DRAFT_1362248 [Lentinus brumalis]|uniref:X-box-binding protein 1 n=1 Tax=Lentinus brumalis TaxID=2498619 RepID=A0A371CR67_9APHY|nr:hypothetical protein OH76DRAFT_1362248 [Polyporus brumalis]
MDLDFSIASPSPSEAQSPSSHSDDLQSGPPRKRARSDVTPEERREARAHRNRIAAQNSRDRRKAQFAQLERRVHELEEENRQLRAGMGLAEPSLRPTEQKDEEREKDRAREKENEELRQRVKTLETGWEAVMKALAASGLPLSMPSVPSSSSPSSNPSAPATLGHPPTNTFPVFVPQSPTFPISPASSHASSGSSTLFDSDDFDSTRHLARVATADAPPAGGSNSSSNRLQLDLNIPTTSSYPQTILIGDAPSAVDEIAMDDLFREILAPSPVSPTVPLPAGPPPARSRSQSRSEIKLAPPPAAPVSSAPALPEIDWESEVEMQRLLAMLPVGQPDAAPMDAGADSPQDDFPSALDLELNGWDFAGATSAALGSMSSVSVF